MLVILEGLNNGIIIRLTSILNLYFAIQIVEALYHKFSIAQIWFNNFYN
jgi:hypothetical protein